jgi:hypothetical protein
MLRRYLVGTLVLPLFLFAAVGCGGGPAAEGPKVENPTVKAKQVAPKGKPGEDGASMRAE